MTSSQRYLLLLGITLEIAFVLSEAGESVGQQYGNLAGLDEDQNDNIENLLAEMYLDDMIKQGNDQMYAFPPNAQSKARAQPLAWQTSPVLPPSVAKRTSYHLSHMRVPSFYSRSSGGFLSRADRRALFRSRNSRQRWFIGKRDDELPETPEMTLLQALEDAVIAEDYTAHARRLLDSFSSSSGSSLRKSPPRLFIGKRSADSADKRARMFIGKRSDADDDLDDDLDEEKRSRMFIGKRNRMFIGKKEYNNMDDYSDKRARMFIGKREDDKRSRMFIGKRPRMFIGKREADLDADDEKRARMFIGKRQMDDDEKRARMFIGKRDDLEEDKRSRMFIGKRDNEKRSRMFIGKRPRMFIGKRADDDLDQEKRARMFIGKREEEKRARMFIGKRTMSDEELDEKRSRMFIGKRSAGEDGDSEAVNKRPRMFIGKKSAEERDSSSAQTEAESS